MIAVRAAHPGDAGTIAAIYAPHVSDGIASFELEPPDTGAMLARMAAGGGLYPWLVAEAEGAVIGYAYGCAFSPRAAYRWTVETSVYVAAAGQRRGAGRRLYATLIAALAARGFAQAIARISLPNDASEALHAASGFAPAGTIRAAGYKMGQWVDVGLWQRALAVPATPPAEPGRAVA